MNRILLSGGVRDLEKFSEVSEIVAEGENTLNIINLGDNVNLDIKISKRSTLTINMFDYAYDKNIDLQIEADDEATFNLNASFIANGKYILNIKDNLYGNNITSNVNIRGINERAGTVTILMDGTVAGETHDNVLNEYARVINKSDFGSVLIPNLIVNTNEVVANHGVSIGGFRGEEIFYLTSKGIDKHTAQKLIEEGFILSIMDEDVSGKIKNILIGR